MKINAGDICTSVSAGVNEMTFSVDEEDQGFIFEMLRSKIYSDPIAAICREIASNSRDANREMMKGHVPVEIGIRKEHAMNGDSSLHLYFKDSGPGISPSRMANVFCKYAKSTKRDDDSMTGGFGLGAKTPFAYSDAFTIITVVDGIEYMYTAYIDESRRGRIGKLNETASTESNCTTIMIPIRPNDRKKFEREIIKYTGYWEVPPTLVDFYENTTYGMHTKSSDVLLKSGRTVIVYDANYNSHFSSACVLLVDGIPYSCDITQCETYKNAGQHSNIKNKVIVIHAATGEVDLAVNRESLNYTQTTLDFIQKIMLELTAEFGSKIEFLISGSKNYFEACVRAYAILENKLDRLPRLDSTFKLDASTEFYIQWLRIYAKTDMHTSSIMQYGGKQLVVKPDSMPHLRFQMAYFNDNGNLAYKNDEFGMFKMYNSDIYVLDTKTKNAERTGHILDTKDRNKTVIFVNPVAYVPKLGLGPAALLAHEKEHLEKVAKSHAAFDALEIPTVLYSSVQYVSSKPVKVTDKEVANIKVKEYKSNNLYFDKSEWDSYTMRVKRRSGPINDDNTLELKKYVYVSVTSMITTDEFTTLKRKYAKYLMSTMGIRVILVSHRFAHHFADCVPLDDLIAKFNVSKLQKIVNAIHVIEFAKSINDFGILNIDFNNKVMENNMRSIIKHAKKYSSLKMIKRLGEDDYVIGTLKDKHGVKETVSLAYSSVQSYMRDWYVTYPLLKNNNIRNTSTRRSDIEQYIRMIDEYNAKPAPDIKIT